VYVIASLMTPRTSAEVLEVWDDRLAGRTRAAEVSAT
jgi:SSS family solute:Na+ symporter